VSFWWNCRDGLIIRRGRDWHRGYVNDGAAFDAPNPFAGQLILYKKSRLAGRTLHPNWHGHSPAVLQASPPGESLK
jgi:hypothetical protein